MGYKKIDFITQAFEEIGYASYIYDAMPEQLQSVLKSLDSLMASWNARGIFLGYPIPSSPNNSTLEQETNVPDSAYDTICCSLAIRIAPRFGKTVQQETKQCAKEGYDNLLIQLARPLPQHYPTTMPLGAGNKPWRWTQGPFIQPTPEEITDQRADIIDLE